MVKQGREIAQRAVAKGLEKVPYLVVKHRPDQQILDPGEPGPGRRVCLYRVQEPSGRSDDGEIGSAAQVGQMVFGQTGIKAVVDGSHGKPPGHGGATRFGEPVEGENGHHVRDEVQQHMLN